MKRVAAAFVFVRPSSQTCIASFGPGCCARERPPSGTRINACSQVSTPMSIMARAPAFCLWTASRAAVRRANLLMHVRGALRRALRGALRGTLRGGGRSGGHSGGGTPGGTPGGGTPAGTPGGTPGGWRGSFSTQSKVPLAPIIVLPVVGAVAPQEGAVFSAARCKLVGVLTHVARVLRL